MKISKKIKKWCGSLLIAIMVIQYISPTVVRATETPSINRQNLTLYLNTSDPDGHITHYYLKVSNAPSRPKWSTSNSKVATVNKNGTVIAKSNGKADITATMGKTKLTCKVTVKAEPKESTLNKAVKVETEIADGYCCFTFTNTSSYFLDVAVNANQYDSNGDKMQYSFTDVHTYLSGKGTYHFYYKLDESASYLDVEKVDVKLADSFQELNNIFYNNLPIEEIVKIKGVSATIGDLEYDSLYNRIIIPYEIVNKSAFPVYGAYQFVFYKNDKVIYIYDNLTFISMFTSYPMVDAKSKKTENIELWTGLDADMFKNADGTYSFDKCEIIPLFTLRAFQSND